MPVSSSEGFQMEPGHTKKPQGLRILPFIFTVCGLVILVLLASTIALAILFVQQGYYLKNFIEREKITANTPKKTFGADGGSDHYDSKSMLQNESYRLPINIIPIHYELHLQAFVPFDASDENMTHPFTTSGEVSIDVQCINSTDVIVVHVQNLTIRSNHVSVLDSDLKDIPIVNIETNEERSFFRIELQRNLTSGDFYRVDFKYAGLISGDDQALYYTQYAQPNGDLRWLVASSFWPNRGRRIFPCFDEPEFKATFTITVRHDSRFTGTHSNGRRLSSLPVSGHSTWTETRFEKTPKMATYALALIITDFIRNTSTTTDNIECGIIARADKLNDVAFAKTVGMRAVENGGRLFNMSYRQHNSKLDMVAIMDSSVGAMENWGLIKYQEAELLYQPGISAAAEKIGLANVVAHEIAHQWFGNTVTCAWWSEIFLNEGFASYTQYPLIQAAFPQWEIEKIFTLSNTHPAFEADALPGSLPLYNPDIQTTSEILGIFGTITYKKGPAVLRMIEGVIGKAKFLAAINSHLAERAGGSATYKQLFQTFTDQMRNTEHTSKIPIPEMDFLERFEDWLTTSGYPIITVSYDRSEHRLTFEQKQVFISNMENANDTTNRSWNIPVTYVTKLAKESTDALIQKQKDTSGVQLWLEKNAARQVVTVPASLEWVLVNIQQMGFYRVNYDLQNWNSLTQQLLTDHLAINMLNRVQLIGDGFTMAKKLPGLYSLLMRMIKYLPNENEYPPWSAAIHSLEYIVNMIEAGPRKEAFDSCLQNLLSRKYRQSFWNSNEVWREDILENYQALSLRTIIIETACYYGMPDCSTEAVNQLLRWRTSKIPLNPHFRRQSMCYGLRYGTSTDWEFVYGRLGQAVGEKAKHEILASLGCCRNDTLINRLLNITMMEGITDEDARNIVRFASRFPENRMVAWSFVKDHFKDLPALEGMVQTICQYFNTPELLNDMQHFIATLDNDRIGNATAEEIITAIQRNILWMSNYSNDILSALLSTFSVRFRAV